MAKKKEMTLTEAEAIVDGPAATPAVEDEPKGKVFDVIKGGAVIRTYSVEIHGKEAASLAKQFADKFHADSIKSS